MQGFCPLASGSKGNALFLGTKEVRILIDLGISLRQVEERLLALGIFPDTIDAILVTHEHSDHIQGIFPFVEKWKVPLFANGPTAKAVVHLGNVRPRCKIFTTGEPFLFGDLEIRSFSVPHDTVSPVGFSIAHGKTHFGICTDLGHVTTQVRQAMQGVDMAYVEANHDVGMLHASSRPQYLKNRIGGKQGHLSNEQCLDLLLSIQTPLLRQIYLAHLSEECNHPEKALAVVRGGVSQEIPIHIALQHEAAPPFFL